MLKIHWYHKVALQYFADEKKMKPRCSIHSSVFIFPWFLSFGVLFFSYIWSIGQSFGSFANNSNRKISLPEFQFLVKNNFFGKWFQQSRFKQNKIGSWHTPPKHEPSRSTMKMPTEKQYLQAFRKQQEILSILTNTESPYKMLSYVTARGLSTAALFAI